MARLLEQYNATIATELATKFNLKNKMSIPKLQKVVINMGVGRATQDKALLEVAVDSLGKIVDPLGVFGEQGLQHTDTVLPTGLRPTDEGFSGSLDCRVDIRAGTQRDLAGDLLDGGVVDVEQA